MIVNESDVIEHFGVKGMKWGVRQQERLVRARRVASGKGDAFDRLAVRSTNSLISNLRNPHDTQKLAARNVISLQARKKRMNAGKTTTADMLEKFGLLRLG